MERPDLAALQSNAQKKHDKEVASGTRRQAQSEALKAAADIDFADAANAQRAQRQGELAGQCFDVADKLTDPDNAALRDQIQQIGKALYDQGLSLAADADQPDPG